MNNSDRTSPTRRRWLRTGAAAAIAGMLFAGCSSGDDAGSGSSKNSSSTTAAAAAGMRGKRYCEVLLVRPSDGRISADVYNSYPLNECPQEQWAALDAKAIAAAASAPLAVLNGPRFWLMDRVEKQGGAADLPKQEFGGIEMYRQASVEIGSLAEAAVPYRPHAVDRRTVFTYDAGRTVFELTAADGTKYVMQTWSQQTDPSLGEADLAELGSRLQLPDGWTYAARTLASPLRVDTTTSAASVLQDDLGNSYSQETD
jgi:hypothetical protein